MENASDKSCREIQILCQLLFRRSCRLGDNVEKYRKAGQDGDGNIAHAQFMLVT